MLIYNVRRVYLVDDSLYFIIRDAWSIVLLYNASETAPVHDYMVWCRNLQVCSVRKYYNWDNPEITNFRYDPFNSSRVCLILANWVSELVLFT
jgi:hypothetical protein